MLIKITATTRQNTELTIWWTVFNVPKPWEVKLKAKELCGSVKQSYRSYRATVVSK